MLANYLRTHSSLLRNRNICKCDLLGAWVPFLLAFSASVAHTLATGPYATEFGDSIKYLTAARMILQGDGFPRAEFPPFFQPFFLPPLYPYFISVLWMMVPESIFFLKLVQSLLFGGSCLLLYRIGLEARMGQAAALCGASLYALNPFALKVVSDVQTEPLHTFLFATGMLAVTKLAARSVPRPGLAVVAGLAFGVASLCRPTALPIGMAMAVCIALILLWKKQPPLLSLGIAGAMAISVLSSIAPWTMANWRSTGELILISDAGGYHFWLGNHPDAARIYDGKFSGRAEFDKYTYQYLQIDLPKARIDEWEKKGGYQHLSLRQREQRWWNEAMDNARQYPGLTARLWLMKAWTYWRPWLHPESYPLRQVLISALIIIPLYGMALVGGIQMWRIGEGRLVLIVVLLLFLFSTGAHAAVHSMVRFRLPYVDPYLSLLAGPALYPGIGKLLSYRHGGKKR